MKAPAAQRFSRLAQFHANAIVRISGCPRSNLTVQPPARQRPRLISSATSSNSNGSG
jgi:hypothetical protein